MTRWCNNCKELTEHKVLKSQRVEIYICQKCRGRRKHEGIGTPRPDKASQGHD
jgi:ribosomal protein L44E